MDQPIEESAPDLPPWPLPLDVEEMAYLGVCRTCHHISFVSTEGRTQLESLGEDIKQIIVEGDRYILYRTIDEAKELMDDWWAGCDCRKEPEQPRIEF
jgi:hypothetical protein